MLRRVDRRDPECLLCILCTAHNKEQELINAVAVKVGDHITRVREKLFAILYRLSGFIKSVESASDDLFRPDIANEDIHRLIKDGPVIFRDQAVSLAPGSKSMAVIKL